MGEFDTFRFARAAAGEDDGGDIIGVAFGEPAGGQKAGLEKGDGFVETGECGEQLFDVDDAGHGFNALFGEEELRTEDRPNFALRDG